MKLMLTLLVTLMTAMASASVTLTEYVYFDGETELSGFIAYDESHDHPRPGVLIIHQWMGPSDHETEVAKRLAEKGYFAFVADIYGTGIRPQNSQEASAEAGKYRGNPELFRQRLAIGLDEMKRMDQVDESRTAAIGYCFGGGGVLELARAGAEVNGVVSLHGGVTTQIPAEAGKVNAKVLVLHGADDPLVPDEDVQAFADEMRAAQVDWTLIGYGGAVHSFTDKKANNPGVSMYDETADRRSWQAMNQFFEELFEE